MRYCRWLLALACFLIPRDLGAESTRPTTGLHASASSVAALVGARIVTEPGQIIERGIVLLRDGVIEEVGTDIHVPPEARVWHYDERHTIYPGICDAYGSVATTPPGDSPQSWNPLITPEAQASALWKVDKDEQQKLRELGITSRYIAPTGRIVSGWGAVVSTDDGNSNDVIIRDRLGLNLHLTVSPGRGRDAYPNSPMGAVALARQSFLDADWYQRAWSVYEAQPGLPRPEANRSLVALQSAVTQQQLVIADAPDEQYFLRADTFAQEFGLRLVIRGSGHEYRRLDAIRQTGRVLILPVDFPPPPDVATWENARQVSLETMMHWHLAPENPARLAAAQVTFAFTTDGLKKKPDFWKNIRRAVQRGLPADQALQALTINPARLWGLDDRLGSLERGKLADLMVTDGDLFDEKTKVVETWVGGHRHRIAPESPPQRDGLWQITNSNSAHPAHPYPLWLTINYRDGKWSGNISRDEPRTNGENKAGETTQGPTTDNESAANETKNNETKANETKEDETKANESQEDELKENELKENESAANEATDNTSTDRGMESGESVAGETQPDDATDEGSRESKDQQKSVPLKSLTWEWDRWVTSFATEGLQAGPGTARLSGVTVTQRPPPPSDEIQSAEIAHHTPTTGPTEVSASFFGTLTWPDGQIDAVRGEYRGTVPERSETKQEPPAEGDAKATQEPVACDVNYPLGAFGRAAPPDQPQRIAFRGATIWTSGPQGKIQEGTLVVERGRIVQLIDETESSSTGTSQLPADTLVVDVSGKHISPGIIDCHSHMATDGGINESTQAITAEVRIGDFIDATDITIYRQLAGGVTAANILHGSANPIGGQNQVIKLRWGALPEDLKFEDAPPGIKFALGENVKQSNWGDNYRSRYPQTRMGVEQIIRDAFHAAQNYRQRWSDWNRTHEGVPPRRDLEMEAIVEILARQRWIHCHSYRQDEILALLRTLEELDVTIGTLQHILEGYKVADALARHGAMASSFADWWAYKFEVYDAIPYNGALMHQKGIVVSFNSDDGELGRHLNHEAAKAVKYGGVPEEAALQFVTLNPARQLRIDRWVGSLEPGKHADFVVWSGPPLSTRSVCEQTWIDGRKYFDRSEDIQHRQQDDQLRAALTRAILNSSDKPIDLKDMMPMLRELWPREDLFCRHHEHTGEHP